MSVNGVKRIVLWGDTQVGKTALLATALFGEDPEMTKLCRGTGDGSMQVHLFEAWRRLRTNRFVQATSTTETEISLALSTGEEVKLVDIRGGISLQVQDTGVRQILEQSDAVLFFAEYDPENRGDQMAAIEAAAMIVGDKPKALALTKCERSIRCEDPLWYREPGWLENTPLWPGYQRHLAPFHDVAWPTSAFGYALPHLLPAVILGEMGQRLPFRIQPRNTAKPIVHLLQTLVSA